MCVLLIVEYEKATYCGFIKHKEIYIVQFIPFSWKFRHTIKGIRSNTKIYKNGWQLRESVHNPKLVSYYQFPKHLDRKCQQQKNLHTEY